MNKTHKIISAACGTLLLFSTSCFKENYLVFDKNFTGIYFLQDTMRYSFGVTPAETLTYTLNIPVQIMGTPSAQPREMAFEVIPDSTDAVEGEQFRLVPAILQPDSINGTIPIVLLRNGLAGNHTDGYTLYKMGIRLTENKNFTPTLSTDDQICVIKFDNAIEQPNWCDYQGTKIWIESKLGKWHPYKLIKMVEYYHRIKETNIETYRNLVELYGENMEKSEYGHFSSYNTVIKKYVFTPTYEYFRDHHDEVLALYPDFPFDFADPSTYDIY